jgi:hypothetical protein
MSHGLSNFFGAIAAWLCLAPVALTREPLSMSSSLAHAFNPVHYIANLSVILIWITGGIFMVVGGLLAFAPFKFHAQIGSIIRAGAGLSEYGNRFGLDGDSCIGAGAVSRMKRATGWGIVRQVARPDRQSGLLCGNPASPDRAGETAPGSRRRQ